jgi:hypothetical protein
MPAELIAVQGMTVIVDQTTAIPPGTVVATILVNPPTGIKVKASNLLVHRNGDSIQVSAITVPSAGATIPDPGPYPATMTATAIKTKAEAIPVLRQNDQSTVIAATPQIPGTPPTPYPVTFQCVVSVPGQIKAKAE